MKTTGRNPAQTFCDPLPFPEHLVGANVFGGRGNESVPAWWGGEDVGLDGEGLFMCGIVWTGRCVVWECGLTP